MLEEGAVLATWRLPQPPPNEEGTMLAERIGDHRPAYLDYEGPVGGDRGQVVRWDGGFFEVLDEGPGRLVVRLYGTRWQGVADAHQREGSIWQFRFYPACGKNTPGPIGPGERET
jgi:hypothetical protein